MHFDEPVSNLIHVYVYTSLRMSASSVAARRPSYFVFTRASDEKCISLVFVSGLVSTTTYWYCISAPVASTRTSSEKPNIYQEHVKERKTELPADKIDVAPNVMQIMSVKQIFVFFPRRHPTWCVRACVCN